MFNRRFEMPSITGTGPWSMEATHQANCGDCWGVPIWRPGREKRISQVKSSINVSGNPNLQHTSRVCFIQLDKTCHKLSIQQAEHWTLSTPIDDIWSGIERLQYTLLLTCDVVECAHRARMLLSVLCAVRTVESFRAYVRVVGDHRTKGCIAVKPCWTPVTLWLPW